MRLSKIFKKNNRSNERLLELNTVFGSFAGSKDTENLLQSIGGGNKIREMTAKFYEKAFEDQILDKFIAYHGDHYGVRLGNWIIEKMGGEGNVWTNTRPRNARVFAHRHAWHCHKREDEKYGSRFKMDDSRTWMRIMFWSAREVGLDKHEQFFDWYVQFIQHFIAVYEQRAQQYAYTDAQWSANPDNIDQYYKNGRNMLDIAGKR